MTVRVEIVEATPEHCAQLAPLLRAGDLAECLAAGFPSGRAALDAAVLNCVRSWAMLFDGEVAAMFGADPLPNHPEEALVWVLTGRAVDRARLTFVRQSKRLLSNLLRHFKCVGQRVDANYQGALDWLEVLGFAIGPVAPHPETGAPFRMVVLRRA